MWDLEKNQITSDEVDTGPLHPKWLNTAWLSLSFVLTFMLFANAYFSCGFSYIQAILLVFPALLFARLAVLDLCYLVLLNIYTVPLFIFGFTYHFFFPGIGWQESLLGTLIAAGIGLCLSLLMAVINKQQGEFGMGDTKMLAVMGAWVGASTLPFAFAIACMTNLLLAFFISKKRVLPFGFGLVVGTWVMVAFKDPFMNALFKFLS